MLKESDFCQRLRVKCNYTATSRGGNDCPNSFSVECMEEVLSARQNITKY
jgi:hypothetical protein